MINKVLRRLSNEVKLKLFKKIKHSDSTKWAIIGLGHMGNMFANILAQNSNTSIIAAVSRSKEKANRFKRRYGVTHIFTDQNAMLSELHEEIDIVYIATPLEHHFEYIKLCLEKGINVICEKPITLTSNDLRELILLSETTNSILIEAMWLKTLPVFTTAVDWIQEGYIGNIKLIRAELHKNIDTLKNKGINNGSAYSVINDYGVYPIAFALSFFDNTPEIIVSRSISNFSNSDSDWFILMENSSVSSFVSISSNFSSTSNAAIIGEYGTIQFGSQFNRTNTIQLLDNHGKVYKTRKFKYSHYGYEFEIEEVNKMIKNHIMYGSKLNINKSLEVIKVIELMKNNESNLNN